MKEILDEIGRWQGGGEQVVVATVVATRRSAPRPVGTSLAVSESGKMCGSVSGGCVESDVFEHAMEVMRSGEPKLLSYGITDDSRGRSASRAAARSTSSSRGRMGRLVRAASLDRPAASAGRVTVIEGPRTGARRWSSTVASRSATARPLDRRSRPRPPGGRTGWSTSRTADASSPSVTGRPRGSCVRRRRHGRVAVRGAKLLGWSAIVVTRACFATPRGCRAPTADRVVADGRAIAEPGPDQTAIVVLTHDERFDVPALAGAPATRRVLHRRARLPQLDHDVGSACSRRACPPRTLERLHGPSGLDLGAESPAETAALDPDRDPRRPRRSLGRSTQGVEAADPRRAGLSGPASLETLWSSVGAWPATGRRGRATGRARGGSRGRSRPGARTTARAPPCRGAATGMRQPPAARARTTSPRRPRPRRPCARPARR